MKHSFVQRAALIVVLAGVGAMVASCSTSDAPEKPSVTVYVSADESIAREVVAAFESATGIDVDLVTDSEAQKTTGLVERLRAESDHPQADVFWSSEVFMTIALAQEDVLASYESPVADGWPQRLRDESFRWYGFAGRARVIAFDPERIAEADRPTSWMDLLQPRWKGRIAMADPRFGTTGGHFGAMKAFWHRAISPAAFDAFAEGLAENEPRILASGNAGAVRAVINGEVDLAMTDTDDVWAAQANGARIALVYPGHTTDPTRIGHGTLVIPNTVALVAGGPEPELGRQFIDFMLSEATERMLAESHSHNIPIRPGLADSYPDYALPNKMRVNLEAAASMRHSAIESFLEAVERVASPVEPIGRPDDDGADHAP